jgi:hypothetical protein
MIKASTTKEEGKLLVHALVSLKTGDTLLSEIEEIESYPMDLVLPSGWQFSPFFPFLPSIPLPSGVDRSPNSLY